jgi:hypothetical protein
MLLSSSDATSLNQMQLRVLDRELESLEGATINDIQVISNRLYKIVIRLTHREAAGAMLFLSIH